MIILNRSLNEFFPLNSYIISYYFDYWINCDHP